MELQAVSKNNWNAFWIWYPGTCWKVNDHFFARKEFALPGPATSAALRLSAYTDYVLHINGHFVGRGPVPCDTWNQSYDTYEVASLLREGKNVIGILAHNYAIGTHWQHRGQGGLIAQLDIEAGGHTTTVATDDTWRVRSADCYASNSPRQFWSMGFMETFDFRKFDDRWASIDFDDTGWQRPQVFGRHPVKPWRQLLPREIPMLREAFAPAVKAEQGTFTLQNVHIVRFDKILPPGQARIVYAETEFTCDEPGKATIHLECDDALKLFTNGQLVLEKNYDQHFARTRVWRAKDEYEQVHYSMGARGQFAEVSLKKGPNRIFLAVDHGVQGWGFVLALLDPQSRRPLAIRFDRPWTLTGPTESTGLSDSLDSVKTDLRAVGSPMVSCSPFDVERVTDYATLMLYEERSPVRECSNADRVILNAGEFCVIDLAKVRTGFPQVEILSSEGGILDIGYTHSLRDDRQIRFYIQGSLKYVDRVYAKPGTQAWQCLHRRTGRYLHISCRKGQRIELRNAGINTIGYPVENIAEFECSDPLLNRIWEVSRYTTEMLMQYGYQDCMRREQGTFNTSSFNYMSRAVACCFGDYDLARKTFRLAFRLQDETGWFHSHGLSSPNCDEHIECLWLLVWLRDFYQYSGDLDFIRECFDGVEDNLRYFSRSINEYGLLDERNHPVFRQGQTIYVDDSLSCNEGYVGQFEGEVSGSNILYYAALVAAGDMAQALGLSEAAARYARKAARVKESFNRRFWNADINRVANWRKGDVISPEGHPILQIAALYFNICDADRAEHLLRYLEHDLGLPDENDPNYPLYTFGFYYYFLEILFRNNRSALAYRLLREYYGRWLELGPTAFGEFFRLSQGKEKSAMEEEYEVHGYGTSAHLHFYTNILGVQPVGPGFAEVLIAPCPGDVTWAKGKIHTPKGPIQISWQVEDSSFILKVDLPPECSYKIRPPHQYANRQIVVNGKERGGV